MPLTPTTTIAVAGLLYLVLGTFVDGFAMMVTTIPVVLPLLEAQNIDLAWFGGIAVMLTEAALISPHDHGRLPRRDALLPHHGPGDPAGDPLPAARRVAAQHDAGELTSPPGLAHAQELAVQP
jgi:tripartite ATP-independent transporter DctM subunit